MAVNLSIKQVPDEVVAALKARATRNRRSLQGELLSILEAAVRPTRLTPDDLLRRNAERALTTGDDATAWLREERDGR